MISPMRRQTAALLVASFSFLAGSACQQERKAATLQNVESLSFVEALAKKSVAEREYSLGPITRLGLRANPENPDVVRCVTSVRDRGAKSQA